MFIMNDKYETRLINIDKTRYYKPEDHQGFWIIIKGQDSFEVTLKYDDKDTRDKDLLNLDNVYLPKMFVPYGSGV